MAYIGSRPLFGKFQKLDNISAGFNGVTTTFNLTALGEPVKPVTSTNLFIVMNGVLQEPDVSYTVGISSITFPEAPAVGETFFGVILGDVGSVAVMADGSVTSAMLAPGTAQEPLISGTNIKTVNSSSILGTGNLSVGTVTTTSVASANGFGGSVATASSTPAITITTSVNGIVKGNGTALSAAVAGTDFQSPIGTISGLAKGNGANALTSATVRTDYAEPTTALATGLIKNTTGTGAHTIAVAGTDFVSPTGSETITNKTITGIYRNNTLNNASASGTVNLDMTLYDMFNLTLSGNTTLAPINVPNPSGNTIGFVVKVTQGGTAYSLTFFANITWLTSGGTSPGAPA